MTKRVCVESDAMAFAYIRSCLMGRAHRMQKKRSVQRQREPAILNDPLQDEDNSSDRLSTIASRDSYSDPNRIIDFITLESAMQCLTQNECRIITALFVEGQRVVSLCNTMHVSKNTVLKTKRNALQKLHRTLQSSYCERPKEEKR